MYTPCELRWSGARVTGLPHVGSRQRMFCGYGDRSAPHTASWPTLYAHQVPPDSFSTRTHGPSSRFSPSLLSGRSWPGSWCNATPHRPLTALHSSPLSAVRLFSPSLTDSSNPHHQASNFQHRKQTPFNSVSSSLSINGPHRVSKTEVPFSATLSPCLSRDFLPQSNFNRRVSPKELCIPPFPRSRASSNLTYTLLTSAAVRSGNDTLNWLRKTMASTICESPQPTRSSLKRSTTAGSPKKAVSFDPSHNQIFYINDCTEKQSSSTKLSVDIDDEPLGSIEGHIVETEISWKIPEESEPSSSSQVLPAESNVPEDFVERQTFHGWLRSPERYGCDSPKDAGDISGRPAQGSSEKETSGITDYVVPNEFETGQNVVTPENQDVPSDVDETTDLQNIREWAFQAETNEKDAINVLEGTDQTACSVVTGLGSEEHSQSLHNVAKEQDRQQPPTVSSGGASIPTPMRPASTQLSRTMPMAVERTSGNRLRMRHGTDPGFLSYSKLPRSEPFTRSSQIGLSPSHIPIGQPLGLFYMPLPTIHRLPSAFGSPIATLTCPIMPRPAWYNSPQVSLHRPAGYSPFAGFGGHFPIRPTVASPLTGGAFYPRFM